MMIPFTPVAISTKLPKPIKILRRSLLDSSDVYEFIEQVKRANREPSL